MQSRSCIRVYGARQHNLKNINVEIPRGVLTVLTGVSGSGKSSLAFDTIFAEGQRKYVESLSAYARQFLDQMQRPDVDRIEGLSPTIAIQQRIGGAGPRSTVATTTELHDYFRVLFARVGVPQCWLCGRPIQRQSVAEIVDSLMSLPPGRRILILAPVVNRQRGGHKTILDALLKEGFVRARIDGEVVMIEEAPSLTPSSKHTLEAVIDRLTIKPEVKQRLGDSIELGTRIGAGRVIVSSEESPGRWVDQSFSTILACPIHPEVRIDELSPQLFSFNSVQGACEACHGLGTTLEFDPDLVVPNANLSIRDGAIAAWRKQGQRLNVIYSQMLVEFCDKFGVLPDVPFRNIPEPQRRILMHGTTPEDQARFSARFEGVLPNLRRRWQTTESEGAKERLHAFVGESPCEQCEGTRLKVVARSVRIEGKNIADVAHLDIAAAREFFSNLRLSGERALIAEPLVQEIRRRLDFLCEAGVGYLALDRASATLSGGEFQRIRLATQIGGQLSGVCYVLDEPTIGLHPKDTARLTSMLRRLSGMENTVIVVEHDEEVIRAADYLIDIGPGAGARGGEVVAAGSPGEVIENPRSVTARFLRRDAAIRIPESRRPANWNQAIEIKGAAANNLKHINVRIPLGCLVTVTGVSGSGKSTLVNHILVRAVRRHLNRSGPRPGLHDAILGLEHIDQIVEVDQSPIGRTPRSNPATYVGVFNLLRDLFSKTREAKIRGYGPARFSFNVKGGRCEHCEGQGVKRIAMHFLPDVYVPCDACGGSRYNRETLEIRYRGKNIADALNMSIDDAVVFFENFQNISRRLQALKEVGLGYLRLGQASNTLSGGEAQQVKLAAQLHKSAENHILYVLDEPTTGLHFADVRNLLTLLNRLVDKGHTVLCIEHNLDVICSADWIIDLGPEGGDEGGCLVAQGTPEMVAASPRSHTGKHLKERLGRLSDRQAV